MEGTKQERELLKKRNKSRSYLSATATDGAIKLDVTSPSSSPSSNPKRKHRYSNSTGRTTDWNDIIAAAEADGKETTTAATSQKIEFPPKSPLRVVVHSSQVSKAGDLPIPSRSGTPRSMASTTIISSAAKYKTTTSALLDDTDLEGSDESASSIVIHPEDQVLSDEDEQGGAGGSKTSPSQSVQIPRLALGEIPGPVEEQPNNQPKLRAHALRPRLGPIHVNKSTAAKFELRPHRQAIGSTWLTPIPNSDNKKAFIISALEDMYLGTSALNSQKLIQRNAKNSVILVPLLKAWPTPAKSPLPDDLGDLDEEVEDLEEAEVDSPLQTRSNSGPSALRSSGSIPGSPSPLQVTTTGNKIFSAPSSPTEVTPLPGIPGDASGTISPATLNNTVAAANSQGKRPTTPGILSSIVGKIRRYTPGSPAPSLASSESRQSSGPVPSASSSGIPNPSTGAVTALGASTSGVVQEVAPESRLGQWRKMFKPWDRIRRLKASSDQVVGGQLKDATNSGHDSGDLMGGRLSEAEEGSLRGSDSDSLSPPLHLASIRGGDGAPALGTPHPSANSNTVVNRGLHKAHARNRLSTAVESESIRGPYFQRLQTGSKYMTRVAENIDNLRAEASEDLASINDALERLSNGHDELEIRYKKLSRQMEDGKHRLQSSNALLYDNLQKTSNAIQHLKDKQQTKPFLKALLAVLGWLILIVGTLIWLFTASFRAALRSVRYVQIFFTGNKKPGNSSTTTTTSPLVPIAQAKRPEIFRTPLAKSPSNPIKASDAITSSPSTKHSGDSFNYYSDALPPRSGSKPSSLHNSNHDISRSTGGSSTASIGSSRGDDDDDNHSAFGDSDEEDSRWAPAIASSPPVQLESHQLQTLEDMSKSIKALRNQELAAKRRAAVEKTKAASRQNTAPSTPH